MLIESVVFKRMAELHAANDDDPPTTTCPSVCNGGGCGAVTQAVNTVEPLGAFVPAGQIKLLVTKLPEKVSNGALLKLIVALVYVYCVLQNNWNAPPHAVETSCPVELMVSAFEALPFTAIKLPLLIVAPAGKPVSV